MSNKKTITCPTCGEIVEEGERFCPSCGESLAEVSAAQPEPETPAVPTDTVNRSVSTGGRTNVMGDNIVNAQDQSTTHNVDNRRTTTTNTVNNVQNTSSTVTNQQTVGSIDNSQQVVNNITIIGGAAGMTLPGGITIPGAPAQQPQQEIPRQEAAPRQPSPQPPQRRKGAAPAAKGIDFSLDDGGNLKVGISDDGDSSSSGSGGKKKAVGIAKWVSLAGVVLALVLKVLDMVGDRKKDVTPAEETPAAVEEVIPAKAAEQKAPSVKATAPKQQAAPKTDTNYEAGMKAYNTGDGLEAVRKFQASGSAEANYMLGVIYETGCGSVGANAMKARSFFKKAAAQGSAEAKAKL